MSALETLRRTTLGSAAERASRSRDHLVLRVFGVALVVSGLLLWRRWADPTGNAPRHGGGDQNVNEWFFLVVARSISDGDGILFTHAQNAPVGVNMMVNPAMFLLSIPLTPITLTLGPAFSLLLVTTVGLGASAASWAWFLRRWVVPDAPWAATAGALVIAFGPAMITHAYGPRPQLMITALLPLILDRLLRLCAGIAVRRDAVILGLLTTCQLFLGEEILLITGIGAALYAVAYALSRPEIVRAAARPVTTGMLLGGVLTFAVAGYALQHQFFGPGSFDHLYWTPANDPKVFSVLSADSIFGDRQSAAAVADSADHNADFGWSVLVLSAVLAVLLRANPVARAAAVMGIGAGLLSLGESIRMYRHNVPGPWRLVQDLPLFNSLIENRVSLICLPTLGILVALGLAEAWHVLEARRRLVGVGVILAALTPLIPTPLITQPVAVTPGFLANGGWRAYVTPGRSLVTVPLPQQVYQDPMHWQIEADLGFAVAGGYFVGPSPYVDVGVYGAAPRPTGDLFNTVQGSDVAPDVTDAVRAQALADLQYWQADAVFVPDGRHAEAKRITVERLLGRPGDRVDGGYVWRVDPAG